MDSDFCWNRDCIAQGECLNIHNDEKELLDLKEQRQLQKCIECDRLAADIARFQDSSNPLSPILSLLLSEYQRQKNQIQSLGNFLDTKTLEIRFLHELGYVLQSSVDLDEVLSVALTAITAGKGFGMNRAFLLLKDRETGLLNGYLGIGPRTLEEAGQVWNEISSKDMDLKSLAQNFRLNKLSSERAKFHDILEQLTIPISDTNHIIVKALASQHPVLIEDAFNNPDVPAELARLLGVDTFLLMPLISRTRRIGMIIADNFITHRRISDDDMRSLESFSFPVAFAIERAALYDKLQVELNRVTEAGKKLKEQQDLIVRMENMALVGRITSSIAHSVRNPLMVIGGFARSMLKNSSESDPRRTFIESIVAETRHLEGVLDEILNYSDSLYPTRDFWDVNQLIETALRDTSDLLTAEGYGTIYTPGDHIPPVYIDFKQLSYSLRTILQSDISGVGEDKTITITSENRESGVVLVVKDRSRNITQAELDHLLIPFSETRDLGAGLGLALCKTMLEKQGIPFLAIADEPEGIRYIITLPTHKEEQS
ncbi:MAG: GAF domain-containing sensor histidine kinase [Desulfuromonadaceae bacterium]|nr:GAF domain-containing sensor histidine kinase [Desulfuromonadaceae bacterium]MDD2854563.1 GAF domain-containing sensor histidine kinase [Desulfuromonadaceae bacterium]